MRGLRRVAPYVVAAAIAIGAVAGLMWRPTTVSSAHRADYVVIAGAAGLRWDDVTQANTPTLWALAQKDSIAALSVRSAHTPTCPADGWITLGAGDYARRLKGSVDNVCPPVGVSVTSPDGIGASVGDQGGVVIDNQALTYGAEPGALADSVRCTVAVGANAAIAAARPYGRVDRYEKKLPANPAKLLSSCTLSIVDLGTVSAIVPPTRAAQAHAVDTALATVLGARPDDSLVLVAGLSDTDTSSRLHVALADGPGYDGGWLTSPGTGRAGYLQLVDLAPTALAALGRPEPTKLFIGAQAQRVGTRPADPAQAVDRLADVDRQDAVQHRAAGWFFWLLVAAETLLLIGAIPLLRRARRSAEPYGARPISPRKVRYVEGLLVAGAVTIPIALFTDVVPWWRAGTPALVFALLGAAMAAIVVAVVMWEPWRALPFRWRGGPSQPGQPFRWRDGWSRHTPQRRFWPIRRWGGWSRQGRDDADPDAPTSGGALAPLTAASMVVVAIIGIDVLSGSRLQLNGVGGYSAAVGTRYAGIGGTGLGAFIVGILMLAACLAQHVPDRRWRPAVVAVVGGLGVIVVGSPQLGADAGGALALTAGVCVAAVIATGGWLSFTRLTWGTLAGLVVLIGFALLDLQRPVAQRGSVGQFLTELHGGSAGAAIHRTGVSDVVSTLTNPLSLLVLVAIVFTVLVLVKPWGGLMRLFGLYPAVRGAMIGMAVASVLGGLLDGDGFATAGAAAAVALPLVTLAALRVLDHADDRTVARSLREEEPVWTSP